MKQNDNENRKLESIKKENKKALKFFIPVIIVAGLVGGLIGFFSQTALFQDASGNLGTLIGDLVFHMSPYLVLFTEAAAFAISLLYYKRGKKDFARYEQEAEGGQESASEEDEARLDLAFEQADRTVGLSLVIMNIGMILSFLFFGIFMCSLTRLLDADIFLPTILAILAFIAGMFTNIRLQQLATDLVKRMNPKMQGSVYDLNFNKKWEASCDEAEMMAIYKASYRGFRTGNMTCVVLWVLVCLGDMFFHYGSMPVVVVSLIWLAMLASYSIESFRVEYGNRR